MQRAQALIPEYAGGDSAYWLLAKIYAQQGDSDKAVQVLRRMVAINADHYEAHLGLAELLESQNDPSGAAEILTRAIYIYPYNPTLHEDLAALFETTENWKMAADARASVVALGPVDMAEAHYRLAYAHTKAGDKEAARYQVLRALEIAPNYYQALELLLELHTQTPNT